MVNDSRRQGPRRAIADELAERLDSEDGLRFARLLQITGVLGGEAAAEAGDQEARERSPDRPAGPRPISIWQPVERGGELFFERPAPGLLGDHYAARLSIPAAKEPGTKRIAFFGESAAAGYLYAPHLTPAQALQAELGRVREKAPIDRFEVVDLARTNERLEPLARTVEAARQLSPDLLVIFAGNNCELLETPEVSPWADSVRARQEYALALRGGGYRGPAALSAKRLRARLEETMAAVAAVGIPTLLVIPEVNLLDWSSRQPPPWLPGGGNARWHELYDRSLKALAEEDFETVEAAAREMLSLDDGLTPTSHRLLSEALCATGKLPEAMEALRAEVDSDRYARLCFLGSPRTTSAVADLLAAAARRHGFAVVDLRTVFAEYTGGLPPDRRLFLDYCHLTREGMAVAMAAVAAVAAGAGEVLASSGGFEDLLAALPEATPEAEATAFLGAAIHGAHRWLPVGEKAEILEYWLRRALELSPGVVEAMKDLALARCAPLPEVLTAAQQRNLASPYRLLLQHGWRWENLDFELLEILAQVVEKVEPSFPAELSRELALHHGVFPEGAAAVARELSRPPHLYEPLERFFPEVMDLKDRDERATHRSPWPQSRFGFAGSEGDRTVRLCLTARLPALPGAAERVGKAIVLLDDREVARFALSERWSRHEVNIGTPASGPHRITLRWPPPPPVGEQALETAIRRLEEGLEAELFPVFGEVFSLEARGR